MSSDLKKRLLEDYPGKVIEHEALAEIERLEREVESLESGTDRAADEFNKMQSRALFAESSLAQLKARMAEIREIAEHRRHSANRGDATGGLQMIVDLILSTDKDKA